jgi:hypothetical protein
MRISHFHPRAFSPAFTRVIAAVLCLAFLAPNAAFACIWDTDTMAGEADGRMDTLNAIVGNFDIYPARYYEMRIERVTRELAADPRQLELYDDIAVASDRVGRSTDAIEWMGRKREQLDALPKADAEAEYRYLANLGTFHAHRWVGSGANRDDLTDLERGRDLIAAAIELNPDAHFGREKYQLMAIEWLIDPPPFLTWKSRGDPIEFRVLPPMLPQNGVVPLKDLSDFHLPYAENSEAIAGFTGLISLGAGAESVDIMNTLGTLLNREGHTTLAPIAFGREQELIDNGRWTLHPGGRGAAREVFRIHLKPDAENKWASPEMLADWFRDARSIAMVNNSARTAYLEQMMARGEHPDTHPEIWRNAPARKPLPELLGAEEERDRYLRAQELADSQIPRVSTIAGPLPPQSDVRRAPPADSPSKPNDTMARLGILIFIFCSVLFLAIITGLRKGREEELAALTPRQADPPIDSSP